MERDCLILSNIRQSTRQTLPRPSSTHSTAQIGCWRPPLFVRAVEILQVSLTGSSDDRRI